MEINNIKITNIEKLKSKLKINNISITSLINSALSIELTAFLALGIYAYPRAYQNNANAEAEKYSTELNKYNNCINNYAKKINQLGLSDLEIIVKLMNDSWASIDGYAKEEQIILGHDRLTFFTEGKGVCRSFADDFTATINAVNPEYNAKNIMVYLNDDATKNTEVLDIKRTVLQLSEGETQETYNETQ